MHQCLEIGEMAMPPWTVSMCRNCLRFFGIDNYFSIQIFDKSWLDSFFINPIGASYYRVTNLVVPSTMTILRNIQIIERSYFVCLGN